MEKTARDIVQLRVTQDRRIERPNNISLTFLFSGLNKLTNDWIILNNRDRASRFSQYK